MNGSLAKTNDATPKDILNQSIPSSSKPASTTISGRIGRSINSPHKSFNGYITDFRFYSKNLTINEISSIKLGNDI